MFNSSIISQSNQIKSINFEKMNTKFFLSVISFALGIGTIVRAPYLFFSFGGVNFLIPLVFFLIVLGIPVFAFELTLGHVTKKQPLQAFKTVSAKTVGIPLSALAINIVICFYYTSMVVYSVFYMGNFW